MVGSDVFPVEIVTFVRFSGGVEIFVKHQRGTSQVRDRPAWLSCCKGDGFVLASEKGQQIPSLKLAVCP